jgi:hypothetical protein
MGTKACKPVGKEQIQEKSSHWQQVFHQTRKPMKNHLLCLCSASLIVCTGAISTATGAEESTPAEKPERPDYYPWTLGISGGTEGFIGGSVAWRFSDHVEARTGFGWSEWSLGNGSIAGIEYNANVRLMGEPLTLDIHPWKKHSFYVAFGWFFNQNQITGTAGENGTIIVDGHPIAIAPGRALNMKIEQQPVNPYLGIGGNFLYFDHAHHWALGGELGVVYSGDQKVSLTRSGPPDPAIDAVINGAANRLQNYASQFKFLPVAAIKLSFSF